MKQEIAESLAKYTLRAGRGTGLLNHFTDLPRDVLEGTVYLFAIQGLLNISIPIMVLPVVVVGKKIVEYGIGQIDERVGFWKVEVDYASRHINTFNAEVLCRLKNIEKCVCVESIKDGNYINEVNKI